MVKIRLFRTGTHKRPTYRIVAIDHRRQRQGRFLENLGTYEPLNDGAAALNTAGIQAWVDKGAQISPTVQSLLRKQAKAGAEAPASA